MFLNGIGQKPELRESSLKGVLRYFYRVLSAQSSLEILKEEEAKYFGSSDINVGSSKLRIRFEDTDDNIVKKQKLIYHKAHERDAFVEGKKFRIIASSNEELQFFTKLIILTLTLGGLGKRSRRGRGSIKVLSCSDKSVPILTNYSDFIQELYSILEDLFPSKYTVDDNKIKLINFPNLSSSEDYPYVKEIKIGNGFDNWLDILKNVDDASHSFRKMSNAYCLGYVDDGSKRFASPIYITVVKLGSLYYPLVTTLNTVMDKKFNNCCVKVQEDYKNSILTGGMVIWEKNYSYIQLHLSKVLFLL